MKAVFESKEQSVLVKKIEGFQKFLPAFHDHIELILVLRGNLQVTIGGYTHTLLAGEMSVCFPYQIHSYEQSLDAQVLLVMFPPAVADVFAGTLLKVCPTTPYIRPNTHLVSLLERLAECICQTGEHWRILTKVYLNAVAGELLQQMPTKPVEEKDTTTIQKIFLYCQMHYREDITVASVAKAVHISQSCVTKNLSARQGCAFRKYINSLRVAEVKRLLEETKHTVTDIMFASGFKNQSTFNRVFYEETGMSPRAYRDKITELTKNSCYTKDIN